MKKEKQKQKRYRKLHFMGVLQNRRSILIRTYKHYNFYIQWVKVASRLPFPISEMLNMIKKRSIMGSTI